MVGYLTQQQCTDDMLFAIGTRILSRDTVTLAVSAVDAAQLGLPQEEAIAGLSFPLKDKPVIAAPGKGH